jgi:hypothetical protein
MRPLSSLGNFVGSSREFCANSRLTARPQAVLREDVRRNDWGCELSSSPCVVIASKIEAIDAEVLDETTRKLRNSVCDVAGGRWTNEDIRRRSEDTVWKRAVDAGETAFR